MPDDNYKDRDHDALSSQTPINLPLGQFTYSFFTDENQNSTANNMQPSVARPANTAEAGSTAAECDYVHPVEQSRLESEKEANQIDVGARYQKEFADKYLQSAAEPEPSMPEQLTLAGAVERQAKAGFSARFNFIQSLEGIFSRLDVNGDRRLSKDELGLVYADGRFTGDEELLVILLLRHLDEIRKTRATGWSDTRGVTFDDIVAYPNWEEYFPAHSSSYNPNNWLRQTQTSSGGAGRSGSSSMSFRRKTNR